MSPDPIGGAIAIPQSLNRYAYVVNNPTNVVDPLGLFLDGGDKILGTPKGPADPLGTTLELADKPSNNKYPGMIVWTLNKAGLPALSETVENGLTKVVSVLAPVGEWLSGATEAVAAYNFVHDTSSCYNKPGG